jgi:RNA-binding protein
MTAELTGKQRRHLRALGHHLDAVVQVGREGVSEAVVRQADLALEKHELIKVRVSDDHNRHEVAQQLAEKCGAHLAQVLGRTLLLYRRRREKPEIELP